MGKGLFNSVTLITVFIIQLICSITGTASGENSARFSTGWYHAILSDSTASYGVQISSISEDNITFNVEYVGSNYSPIYVTDDITASIANDTVSFEWADSWGNYGNGTLTFESDYMRLTMVQTYTAQGNRGTLEQDNILLYPSNANLIKDDSKADITVTFNGTALSFDQPPIIINDRTMVPIRTIFEAMGYEVEWDSDTQTAAALKDSDSITVRLGSRVIYYMSNGRYGTYTCDTAPQIISDRILVPVRAIAETAGCTVEWDGGNNKVIIVK